MTTSLEAISEKLDALLAQSQQPEPRFLTVDAAAAYCSLSPESIRRLLSAGKLTKLHPIRGRVTIDRRELDTFSSRLDRHTTPRPRFQSH